MSKKYIDTLSPTLTKMRYAGIDAFDLAELLKSPGDPDWTIITGKMEDMLFILARGCPTLQFILQQIQRQLIVAMNNETPI